MARDFKNGITLNGNAVGQLATSGTPADLGTAGRGTSTEAARADHVHNASGGSGAPLDATYVTTSSNGTLSNERVLTQGSYTTVTDNGSSFVTVAVDATSANTASKVVARDASGNFSAGIITAALTGNASTASALSSAKTITLSGDVTGSVSTDLSTGPTITTAIGSGVIVDADISATAAIQNSKLANSSITVNGTTIALGGSGTATAAAGTLTGTTLNSTVTASSLTSFGTSPTVTTPALTLSSTSSTAEGRIAWDATNDQIEIGTGTTLATFGQLGSTSGVALGTAAAGTAATSAHSDHVHPTTGVGVTSSTLAQFAATTSAQLAGVISDETGSGSLVFGTTPTITTPLLTLSTTASTADGRIYWDATTDSIKVGNGTTAVTFSAGSTTSLASTVKWGTD